MILYIDETADSKKALDLVKVFGDVPIAPASGSGLPEFVHNGVSYVGLRQIKSYCELAQKR